MNRKAKLPFDPKEFLLRVNGGRAISDYRKDKIVFRQGDPADAIFYIQKGKIKLTVVSERGKEAVVGILEHDHFFGEGCLNGHPLRVTTATAIEQSLITRIPKAEMIATLHDHPEFSELFMADLLSRNSQIEEDLIDQLFNSSEKRLARVLLLLANFGKEATAADSDDCGHLFRLKPDSDSDRWRTAFRRSRTVVPVDGFMGSRRLVCVKP